jgi:hypothetical protein
MRGSEWKILLAAVTGFRTAETSLRLLARGYVRLDSCWGRDWWLWRKCGELDVGSEPCVTPPAPRHPASNSVSASFNPSGVECEWLRRLLTRRVGLSPFLVKAETYVGSSCDLKEHTISTHHRRETNGIPVITPRRRKSIGMHMTSVQAVKISAPASLKLLPSEIAFHHLLRRDAPLHPLNDTWCNLLVTTWHSKYRQ